MNDIKIRINEIISNLKQERDELQVKLHLAKLETSDEWKKLEVKFSKLEAKAAELGNATAEASKDIAVAAKSLGAEIRDGFKSIARRF